MPFVSRTCLDTSFFVSNNVRHCLVKYEAKNGQHALSQIRKPQSSHDLGICHRHEVQQVLVKKFGARLTTIFDALKWIGRHHTHVLPFLEEWRLTGFPLGQTEKVLHWAIRNNIVAVCRMVKDVQTNPKGFLQKIVNRDGPDMLSVIFLNEHGCLEMLKFFVGCGMKLCDISRAFIMAAEKGRLDMVQYLREWRGQYYVAGRNKLTLVDVRFMDNSAFRGAASNGHLEMCQLLKDWRDELSDDRLCLRDVRANGNQALRFAAQNGHLAILKFLKKWQDETKVSKNGDPSILPESGLTLEDLRSGTNHALRLAAQNGHLEVLKFLKKWKFQGHGLTASDVQSCNNWAISKAARNKHLTVCQFLLDWIKETSEIKI